MFKVRADAIDIIEPQVNSMGLFRINEVSKGCSSIYIGEQFCLFIVFVLFLYLCCCFYADYMQVGGRGQ